MVHRRDAVIPKNNPYSYVRYLIDIEIFSRKIICHQQTLKTKSLLQV